MYNLTLTLFPLVLVLLCSTFPGTTKAFPVSLPQDMAKRGITGPWTFTPSRRPYPYPAPDPRGILDAHSDDAPDANGESLIFYPRSNPNFIEGSIVTVGRDPGFASERRMMVEGREFNPNHVGVLDCETERDYSSCLSGIELKVRGPLAVFRPKANQWFIAGHDPEQHGNYYEGEIEWD